METLKDKKIAKLEEALKNIADPLEYLRKSLKEGESLSGTHAIQLANNASWLQGIAKEALSDLASLNEQIDTAPTVITDEELMSYFDNHSRPVLTIEGLSYYLMTKGDAIDMVRHFESRPSLTKTIKTKKDETCTKI